jgi:hypothetical protein
MVFNATSTVIRGSQFNWWRRTRRKTSRCCKSLTNFITKLLYQLPYDNDHDSLSYYAIQGLDMVYNVTFRASDVYASSGQEINIEKCKYWFLMFMKTIVP